MNDILRKVLTVADSAQLRYGDFRSTHEALGVALEEWNELQDAIRRNAVRQIKHECIDLAAVLLRLAFHCDAQSDEFIKRSMK